MRKLIVAAAIAACSTGATAQVVRAPVGDQTRGYVGAGIGQSRLEVDCGTVACDKSDTGWKLFGGYNFNKWLGAEVGYYDLGTPYKEYLPPIEGQIDVTAFAAFATFRAEENDWWVAAKLGIANVKAESRVIGGTLSIPIEDKSKTDLAWGVGIGYNVARNYRVQVEYERFKAEALGFEEEGGFTSVSFVYRF